MDKDQDNTRNGVSPVVSAVLSPLEASEIKELSDHLGISTSHLGRALIRLGLMHVQGVNDDAKEAVMLKLIKLGK